jgi:hypothetical protein
MNRMMNEKWPWIEAAHEMRSQVLDLLNDTDLANHPGGQNMTVGAFDEYEFCADLFHSEEGRKRDADQ